MLYLFALVFVSFAQDMPAMEYVCNPNNPCGCSPGPVYSPKIVNGEPASNGIWSWTIALRNGLTTICGGSILNEQYVITAAHCLQGIKDSQSNITICAGTTRPSNTCPQSPEIQNVINHPLYNRRTYENDIALIRLKVPFNFNDKSIARICLPNIDRNQNYPEPGTNVTAVGWGRNKTGHSSDTLRQVTVQVVAKSMTNCHHVTRDDRIQLCAGAPGKGKTLLFNRCFLFVFSLLLSSRHL
jgi:secreted trypsin-like serine protease